MKNQYQTLKGKEAPFKPEALSKVFDKKEPSVIIKGEETINDLKYIQEMIYCNKGIKVGLQQVVNYLIHHYLKER